jgi:DHA1 family tetracycline resistance protein-like MFS transporter
MAETAAITPQSGPRKAALYFILFTLFLDVLALGVVIPVLPRLILEFEGGNMQDATIYGGYISTAFAVMQFLFQPVLGALSDRYGRRPVLLFSMAGLGIDYVIMALAPNMWWLLVGRISSGIAAATFSTCNAYIADVTPPEGRAQAFGMMGAAFGIGFVLGPLFGGWLGSFDPRLPFWVAAGFCLLNALYGYFVLPESLPVERRKRDAMPKFNLFGSVTYFIYHPSLAGIGLAYFFYQFAHAVYPAVWVLNTQHRFGWNEMMTGLSLAVTGVLGAIVQGGFAGRAAKAFGNRNAMLIGLSFGVAGMAMYGLAPSTLWMFAAMPIVAVWGLHGAAMQAYITTRVDPRAQGELQGAFSGLMGLGAIFTPTVYSHVFAWSINPGQPAWYAGAPFLLAALLLLIALLVIWRTTRAEAQ